MLGLSIRDMHALLPPGWRLTRRPGGWVLRQGNDVLATAPTAYAMLLKLKSLLV